ncbi:MAG TPA: alpha-E domain-containing protein, partial [Bryobacteraceae bacterium]|nr:alpha-E domain-containing protein [Bryobacteraceae bacterium]
EPVDTFTMLRPRNEPIQLQRSSADLPSRAGDNLFWMGRYIERSENHARTLRTLISRVRQADEVEFQCLLRLHRSNEIFGSKLPKKNRPTPRELENEIISLMVDTDRGGSLASTLSEVTRVGNSVRERLSSDYTRLLGELAGSIKVEEYMLFVEYSAVLTGCLELLSALSGMERENITRGHGWLLLNLGRRLERAMHSVRQMREITKPLAEEELPLLEYVLEVADSSITYRTKYYTTLQPLAVLDVLLTDRLNPRSVAFQLRHIADVYEKLPRHSHEDLQEMKRAAAFVEDLDLSRLELPPAGSGAVPDKNAIKLISWLADMDKSLPRWSNQLSERYFSHARTLPTAIGE